MPDNPVPSTPAGAQPLKNLRSGLALALLRPGSPAAFVRSFDQLLALLIVNLLVWIGLEWWQHAHADTVLGLDAFYGISCYFLMTLCGCALVARMENRETDSRALLIPLLAAAPAVQVVFRGVSSLLPGGEGETLAMLALGAGVLYLGLLALRVLQAAYGRVRLGPGLTAVLLVLAAPAALDAMQLDTRLWISNDTDTTSDDDDDTAEPVLYSQPQRLAGAIERVQTQRRDGGSVYFVGFAGDGDQAVFRREALLAERVVSSHFGLEHRSLSLINDDDDRETYPLATVTGLSQGLKLLGERIDRANDLLVLTLTSHGSADGLEVSNGGLPLLQLGPNELRQALDDAGIKWRVVIVSACYAGVFVDALKNDTTAVITAADASHSSFGCDDDRELTYFGQAFFKEALPGSGSLEQAFGRAAALIKERETAQKLPHSNPQMFVGSQMHAKLEALEARARSAAARDLTVSAGAQR